MENTQTHVRVGFHDWNTSMSRYNDYTCADLGEAMGVVRESLAAVALRYGATDAYTIDEDIRIHRCRQVNDYDILCFEQVCRNISESCTIRVYRK